MQFIRTITLDFCPESEYEKPTVCVKQLDSGSRYIEIEPEYMGNRIDIRNYSAKLYAERPDHSVIIKECEINPSGNIQTEVTSDITAIPGLIRCDIKLTSESSVVSSAIFYFQSVKSVLENNIIYASRAQILIRSIRVISEKEPYILNDSEKLVFEVRKNKDTPCVIRKEIGVQDYVSEKCSYRIIITSEEMNINEGEYLYNVSLKKGDKLLKVIGPTQFTVT